MKTRSLLAVFLTISLFIGCVQYNKSSSTVSKDINRENIEADWDYKNNKWYYYDNEVNFSPAIFSIIETLDSTSVVNGISKKYKKRIDTKSTGFYETSEPGWKWDTDGWSYNENLIKSFPPSFKRKISQTVVTENLIKEKKTITIEESFRVNNQRWTWGAEENSWLLDGNVTDSLPTFSEIKSTKTVTTSPKVSVEMYNKKLK